MLTEVGLANDKSKAWQAEYQAEPGSAACTLPDEIGIHWL